MASGECLDEVSLKGMEVRGDLATSSLYLSIPQAYLDYVSEDWDPRRAGMKAFRGCCLTTTSMHKPSIRYGRVRVAIA